MNRYLQLFRLGNCIMAVAALVLAVLIGAGFDLLDYWQEMAFGAVVVFAFVAGGNALNDYTDREVDKLAHPERPLPSGRMSPSLALWLSAGAFVISFAASLFLNWVSILIVVSAIAIMILYESRTKKMGLSGNLSIAGLTGGLFLLGGAMVGHLDRTVVIAAMAALATLGREIVKDIQDMEGDFDRNTLPKRIGRKGAGIVAAASFLIAVGLSPVPYLGGIFGIWYMLTVLVADAIFIYSSIVQFENPKKGQTWAKIGMAAALAAFLVGGIT